LASVRRTSTRNPRSQDLARKSIWRDAEAHSSTSNDRMMQRLCRSCRGRARSCNATSPQSRLASRRSLYSGRDGEASQAIAYRIDLCNTNVTAALTTTKIDLQQAKRHACAIALLFATLSSQICNELAPANFSSAYQTIVGGVCALAKRAPAQRTISLRLLRTDTRAVTVDLPTDVGNELPARSY
jgi:hypothetical protein